MDKRSLNNHFSVCRGKWSDCSTKPEETDCCGLPHKVQIQQKISYFVFRLPSYIQGSNSIKYLAWISCIFLPQLEQRLALPHLPSNSHPLHSQLHTGYVTIPLQLGSVKILKQNWLPWACSGAWIRKELKLFIFYKMTMVATQEGSDWEAQCLLPASHPWPDSPSLDSSGHMWLVSNRSGWLGLVSYWVNWSDAQIQLVAQYQTASNDRFHDFSRDSLPDSPLSSFAVLRLPLDQTPYMAR